VEMCSDFLAENTRRAATLQTDCSRCITVVGAATVILRRVFDKRPAVRVSSFIQDAEAAHTIAGRATSLRQAARGSAFT